MPSPFAGRNSWHIFFMHKIIPICLSKLIRDKAEDAMVTPYWLGQYWFPDMMKLSSYVPRLLPPAQMLLTSPRKENHPLT
jgi:hypothetical protein